MIRLCLVRSVAGGLCLATALFHVSQVFAQMTPPPVIYVSNTSSELIDLWPGTSSTILGTSTLSVQILTLPSHGSLVPEPTLTPPRPFTYRYTPNAGYRGNDSFTYRQCVTSSFVAALTTCGPSLTQDIVVYGAPVAVDDTVLVTTNRSVVTNVAENDSNVDPGTVTMVVPPTQGVASVSAPGQITYTPNTNYEGPDQLTYSVCATVVSPRVCVRAVVRFSVGRPVSDIAVSKTALSAPRVGQNTTFRIHVTNNGPEPSAGELTLVDTLSSSFTVSAVRAGGWTCDVSDLRITCRTGMSIGVGESRVVEIDATVIASPTTNAEGLCSGHNQVSISLADGPANSRDSDPSNNASTLNFAIAPVPPVANPDTKATLINRSTGVNPILNDRANLCGGRLQASSITLLPATQRGRGSFGVAPDGTITFAPDPGFRGTASIDYTVTDAAGQRSNAATFTVNVLPPNYFVSNFVGNSVTIIDADSVSTDAAAVVATVSVPNAPDGILVGPGGDVVYVASYGANSISKIDGLTLAVVQSVPVAGGPLAMGALPSGELLVTQFDAGSISIVSVPGGVVRSLNVGAQPAGLALSPDGKTAYVAVRGTSEVAVVDMENFSIATRIPVGAMPGGVALTPDGDQLLIANGADNSVSVIDTVKREVAATIALPGISPGAIAVDRLGRRAYVTQFYSNDVAIVDIATRSVAGRIATGRNPTGISFDFDETNLLVADFGDNTLSVIPVSATERRTPVRTGAGPASFGQFVAKP